MAKYISFMNRKGGVGKSTLLTLTATALHHRTDLKILVIDADLQASIYQQREADKEETDTEGFDIESFSFVKTTDTDIPMLRFTKLIDKVDKKYDLVFIDPAGTMEGEVVPLILTLSDTVIIPIIGSMLDMQSTMTFLSLVEDVNQQREEDLQVIGVINKKDRTGEYGQLEHFEGVGGMHLLEASISNRVEYRRLSTLKEVVSKKKHHEFNTYLYELTKILKL